MFVLDNSEQGDRQVFASLHEAVSALLGEVQRQFGNDTDAASDAELVAGWRSQVFRARELLARAQDGASRVDEPVTFALPNGELLTLSEVDGQADIDG